ncbi:TPA: hypothetical protein ACW7YU_004868, partial [Klebsiella aerogenes]
CNAKCWVKCEGAFHAADALPAEPFMPRMCCLTPVALRLPGLQFPGSPAKRSAAGFFPGHAAFIGATV